MNPEYAEAYNNRGFAYLNLGQGQAAVDDYSEAIRLNRQNADAFSGRALAYTLLGKEAEARKDVGAVVELGVDPSDLKDAIQELKERIKEPST